MRIIRATGSNFQSYKSIDFSYENLGLALISGQTKAGKSTVMDLSAWCITGTTSKDSAADDVKSWFSDGEPTQGRIVIEHASGMMVEITRTRGVRSSLNDLYYTMSGGEPVRGKDAADTQKQIYALLGIDADLLVNGSYLHQFSKADQFFIAKAKDRRETLERIANLDLPIKLAAQTSEARKVAKKDRDDAALVLAKAQGKYQAAQDSYHRAEEGAQKWTLARSERLAQVQGSIEAWNAKRASRAQAAGHSHTIWADAHRERVATAEAQVAGYETEKFNRAVDLSDKLGVLEGMVVSQESFDAQKVQLKQQLKTIESLEEQYRAAQLSLHSVKSSIARLQKEYAALTDESLTGGVCPTCMGPTDNEHRAARIAEIEVQVVDEDQSRQSLEDEMASLKEGLASKSKLMDALQNIFRKETENKSFQDKIDSLRKDVTVLRAQKNPYTGQLERLAQEANPYEGAADKVLAEVNPYESQLVQITAEKNPFDATVQSAHDEVFIQSAEVSKATKSVGNFEQKVSGLNWLYDKSFELRGRLLEQSVKQLEAKTNYYLERFFDAELRVQFTLESSDKLEVTITNEGYNCPYAQLSGGERCLLKLAFAIPYMKAVEDKAGVKFNVLMLDEALNGLDPTLKLKAFTLLQSLEQAYETILLIDHHEEFKNMFSKRFSVTKAGAFSQIEEVVED